MSKSAGSKSAGSKSAGSKSAGSESTIDHIEFFWRQGCGFCMMLERALSKAGIPMKKHNIWDDPANAEIVRSWANGNETVPTVVVGDVGLVNPTAREVISVLSTKAPHLLA